MDEIYDVMKSLANEKGRGVRKSMIVEELWKTAVLAIREWEVDEVMLLKGGTVYWLVDPSLGEKEEEDDEQEALQHWRKTMGGTDR